MEKSSKSKTEHNSKILVIAVTSPIKVDNMLRPKSNAKTTK